MKEGLVKTFLHNIFGVFTILRYPECSRKNSPPVTRDQFVGSARISTLGGRDQRAVGVFIVSCMKGFHDCGPHRHLVTSCLTLKDAIVVPETRSDENNSGVADRLGFASTHGSSGSVCSQVKLPESWHSVYLVGCPDDCHPCTMGRLNRATGSNDTRAGRNFLRFR